jgi:hypothetical protein
MSGVMPTSLQRASATSTSCVSDAQSIPAYPSTISTLQEQVRPGWTGGRFSFMRRVLTSHAGKELDGKRQTSIEPVFGHTKHNRQF